MTSSLARGLTLSRVSNVLRRYSFKPIIINLAKEGMFRVHLALASGDIGQIHCPKMFVPIPANRCG